MLTATDALEAPRETPSSRPERAVSVERRRAGDGLPMLLTPEEVAALLRTTRKAIYNMRDRGQLPGVVHVGRRLLIRRDELLQSLAAARVPSSERYRR